MSIQQIRKLIDHYNAGSIPIIQNHEVNPGLPKYCRLNYIYFTLPVSINFQRSSPAMWRAALATYQDPETNYLFYPEKVVQESFEKIQADLLKHKLSLQRNKHTEIWTLLSKTFFDNFDADPRAFFHEYEHDVVKIIQQMQVERKKQFPYLSGLKLSNYWLFILSKYTDIKLKNMHEISIIPDTHIIQSTIKLGLAEDGVTSKEVESIWKALLKGSGISPVDLHPVLWHWSRNNFTPHV